ncbi:MAG: Asp-tRNA(Asn)/Glu-tRNA(Gln) amidotransferase subunit GatC [Alphaproteobacteria bacterium]|nr:MAG: Asp-tRNA(Asn)/Glu-tRNA(Gln) amidotransferase subunit GatC [Alphaproteobacteria bacterium]
MSLEIKDIEKLAKLSRLTFTPEQIPAFAAEFENILDFVGQIQSLDTKGVAPLTTTANVATSPERADVPAIPANPLQRRDELLANAPKSEQGFIVVPKIVE